MASVILTSQGKALMEDGKIIGLPYDAEVEYLQSTNNKAYITIPYSTQYVRVISKLACNGANMLCGRDASAGGNYRFKWGTNASKQMYYGWGGTNYPSSSVTLSNILLFDLQDGEQKAWKDGVLTLSSSGSRNKYMSSFYLGAAAATGPNGTMRIYAPQQVYVSGKLVFDGIPVRVGQTGYLYDKLSGTMYRSVGTADFTVGSDV